MRILLVLAALIISLPGRAQLLITGKVVNTQQEPLPAVVVRLYDMRDSLRYVTLTNDKGLFEIPATYGVYRLILTYVGYQPDTFRLTVTANVNLGTLILHPYEHALQEVKITIRPARTYVDRKVYVITDSLRQRYPKTSLLLKRIPEVAYNPALEEISVLGSHNVLVLVDGIPRSPKAVLNIPSSQIAKIEIITEPTGQYGLEGYDAIINIITRQYFKGYELTFGSMIEGYPAPPDGLPYLIDRGLYTEGTATFGRNTIWFAADAWDDYTFSAYRYQKSTPADTLHLEIVSPQTQFSRLAYGALGFQHRFSNATRLALFGLMDISHDSGQVQLQHTNIATPGLTIREISSDQQWTLVALLETAFSSRWKSTIQPEVSFSRLRYATYLFFDRTAISHTRNQELSFQLVWNNTLHIDSSRRLSFGTVLNYERAYGLLTLNDTTPFRSDYWNSTLYAGYLFTLAGWQGLLTAHIGLFRLNDQPLQYELLPDLKFKRQFSDLFLLKIGYRLQRHLPDLSRLHSGQTLSPDLIVISGNPNLKAYYSHHAYVEANVADIVTLRPYIKWTPRQIVVQYLYDSLRQDLIAQPVHAHRYWQAGLAGSLQLPLTAFLFLYLQGQVYRPYLAYGPYQRAQWMQHWHSMLEAELFNGYLYLYLQANYHQFYTLLVNGIARDYTTAFLAGADFNLLNDRLGISLIYYLPVKDPAHKLYPTFLSIRNDHFSLYRETSSQPFLFNARHPYLLLDIYYFIRKGTVLRPDNPPQLPDQTPEEPAED